MKWAENFKKRSVCSVCVPQGYTPLHEASSEGHQEAVRALLEAGADVHAKDVRCPEGGEWRVRRVFRSGACCASELRRLLLRPSHVIHGPHTPPPLSQALTRRAACCPPATTPRHCRR